MQRYKYIISFVLLYLTFSSIIICFSKRQLKFIIGKNRKSFNLTMFFIEIILITISSIRLNSGSDYRSYWIIYNWSERYKNISYIISLEGIQSGLYIIAFKLKEIISLHYNGNNVLEQNALFILVAIVTNFIIIKQMMKHSKNLQISVMVYLCLGFYMISNNLLKQQIAMSIFIIAFDEFYNHKYIKYIILCTLACLFHITVLLPAILLVFCSGRSIKLRYLYFIIALLFLLSFGIPVFGKYFSVLSVLGFSTKYFENILRYSLDWRRIIYVIGSFIMYLYLYLSIYRYKNELTEEDNKTLIYMRFIVIGLLINVFAINYWLLIRFSYYFYQFAMFLIPNYFSSIQLTAIKKRNLKIILVIFAMFFAVFSGENTYYSYHTVFNKNMESVYLDEYIKLYE